MTINCFTANNIYDVVVIGGGHAGCEAATAAAKLGARTCLFAINLDSIANCPCNPAIGGTAKGHLVREIDAMGGVMGKVTDATFIQSRILNRGKGAAVHSLRAQIDKKEYQTEMKYYLEKQPGIDIRQAEICEIKITNGSVVAVVTQTCMEYKCKAVIIAVGTYLNSEIIIGEYRQNSGPDGFLSSCELSKCLTNIGIKLRRFKTGTPPRVSRSGIDFSQMELQHGDEDITPFSFETKGKLKNKVCCHLTYTNDETKKIIIENLHRSPIYGNENKIKGIGPRYCPSIEDKIMKFRDKERHQIFVEPIGIRSEEMYIQGFSSSMPADVQSRLIRTLPGLKNANIMRNAYAIEYECLAPLQLHPTLEFKKITGLYGAGQFNGSSGYEEAAAQGLMAGINAALAIADKPQIVLSRSAAYIGTLIDDLVTKEVDEPYRIMTSRSEYRLLLRQDNADLRLTELGYKIGLIHYARYKNFLMKKNNINEELSRLKTFNIAPTDRINNFLCKNGSAPIVTGINACELLKRPEINYLAMKEIDDERPDVSRDVGEQVEITLKYEGYIKKQQNQARQFEKLENKKIPFDIDYRQVNGLRLEAVQKLSKLRPFSLGQVSLISGISPADLTALILHINKCEKC